MNRKYILGGAIVVAIFLYTIWLATLNIIGPSTEYLDPRIPTATIVDGKPTVYLGDLFYVQHTIVRHTLNGNCTLAINRYAEDVDGPTPGKRHQIDYAELQFIGNNEVLHPRWPPADDPYKLSFERDRKDGLLKDKPLLPEGVDQITMDFFVVSRYYCNPLDYIFPRYIQGGHPDESPRVRAVVKRNKP